MENEANGKWGEREIKRVEKSHFEKYLIVRRLNPTTLNKTLINANNSYGSVVSLPTFQL